MSTNRKSTFIIVIASAFLIFGCSGTTLNPTHNGKYEFEGQVKDEAGKPVANAWVKVRDWETLTDSQGRWKQEQILHCGSLTDQPAGFDEEDAVLVTANGYQSKEEKFKVMHPGWFMSCKAQEHIVLDTVLTKVGSSKAVPEKSTPSKEENKPTLPQGGGTYL